MPTELNYLVAFAFMASFFILLFIIGMPSDINPMNTFDFLWLGGGVVAVTSACVVATGIPCAAALGIYGFSTLITYIGTGILTTGGTMAIVKGLMFTPISLGLIYIISKLARGGG